MGKVYRNRIPYAGGGNVKECTLAQYNTWKANGQLVPNTTYNIIDAPNLNETAKQISYDGSTDTVWDKVEAVNTRTANINGVKRISGSWTTNANGIVTSSQMTGGTNLQESKVVVLSATSGTPDTSIRVAQYSDNLYFVAIASTGGGIKANTSVQIRVVYMDAF